MLYYLRLGIRDLNCLRLQYVQDVLRLVEDAGCRRPRRNSVGTQPLRSYRAFLHLVFTKAVCALMDHNRPVVV